MKLFGQRFPPRALFRLALPAALCWPAARAQETPSAYSAFRIVSERNIFDPNRGPRARRDSPPEAARKVKVDAFALLGTMSYEKGTFAFFDGTSPDYRKALKPGDQIAGYKIADIRANHVKLETNGQVVELPVGMQMKREDEGEWNLAERTGPVAGVPGAPPPRESEPKASGEESEILKRLMQKRQEEK